jgi:hypothetical protein
MFSVPNDNSYVMDYLAKKNASRLNEMLHRLYKNPRHVFNYIRVACAKEHVSQGPKMERSNIGVRECM